MRIAWPTLGTLWRAEMRMILRDRRSIVAALILPLLVMPLVLIATSWVSRQHTERLETAVYRYAIRGSQAETARRLVASAHDRRPDGREGNPHAIRFEEQPVADAASALQDGELDFIIEALTPDEAGANPAAAGAEMAKSGPADQPRAHGDPADTRPDRFGAELATADAPLIRIVFRADRDVSAAGMQRMAELLHQERLADRAALLKSHGLPVSPDELGTLVEVNVATEGQVVGSVLGRVLTLFLLLFLIPSAAVVATDSLAGEKERGTLETLLTTAAGRTEIIAAKHLAILAVTLVITTIQAANLLVYVGFELIPLPVGWSAAISPAVALFLVMLYLPVAALVAGVLLLTSGYARSYKEAQLYFMPVFLLGLATALAPLLPGLPFRSLVILLPLANLAVAAREILAGAWDWPMILLAWLVTAAAAHGVLRWGVRFLAVENLVTTGGDDSAGGPTASHRFERHVLRWFAVLWALLLIVSGYVPPSTDIRVQVAINILVLFLGASILLIWRYHLDPRRALALRAPRPMVWLAVLLGVPGGMLTGIGIFRLADRFIPVPQEMIEAFSEGLLSSGVPFWQLLMFLAVIPGIVEEITFRGVLLHGLHRRLHPAVLVLVAGTIFGLFHGSLFRILPTAFLGMLFAVVTLQTGSLYPAISWHVLHNAASVAAGHWGLPLDGLDPAVHVGAAVILGAALWLIWRHRTPYPGLRPWRRPGTFRA